MRRAVSDHKQIFVAAVLIGGAIIALAGWHYWTVYNSLTNARDHLLAAQQRLSDVGLDLHQEDIDIARQEVQKARSDIDNSKSHLKWDPLVRLGSVTPGVEAQVDAIDDLLDIATLLVEMGQTATTAAEKAIQLRDGPPSGEPLTKSLIDLLDDTSPDVQRIQALADEVVRIRLEMGDTALLPPLARVRDRLDEELPRLANAVEQAEQSKSLLAPLLGFEGDRRYLVLALNSGELQPGGGLVTAAGILPVSNGVNGAIDFTDSVKWRDQATALGVPYIEPPSPLKRYLLRDFTWNLLVSNWNPDFPTWSQQALDFYQLVHGPQEVDGIIAVDLTVLQRLLAVTGPKTLDIEGVGPVTFEAGAAVLQLEALTRQPFEPTDDRKSVIGQLAEAVMADLLKLPSDRWGEAVDVMRKLGKERHIQVLSFDPAEQTIIRDFRWDGRLEQPKADYLMFNEASVLSTKLNLIVKPQGSYSVQINELGDVRHELRLNYTNPLDDWAKDKDPKLVSQLMLGGLYGGYLRILGPRGMSNFEVEVDDAPAAIDETGTDPDVDWFGTMLPVGRGESHEVVFRWTTTAVGSVSQDGYRLYIQKQPGTDGMCLDLDVERRGSLTKGLVVQGGSRDAQGRVCLTSDVQVLARF